MGPSQVYTKVKTAIKILVCFIVFIVRYVISHTRGAHKRSASVERSDERQCLETKICNNRLKIPLKGRTTFTDGNNARRSLKLWWFAI